MKILNPIPVSALPDIGKRGFTIMGTPKGNIARSKRKHRSPRSDRATYKQILLFNAPWAKWRRTWFAHVAHLWLSALSPTERAWWTSQAAIVPFTNLKGVYGIHRKFEWFMHYQFRRFDTDLSRYMPFPNNSADFPLKYDEPWTPPSLANPVVLYATANGQVQISCKNKTPAGADVLPVSWFTVFPPTPGEWPTRTHPWYWYNRDDYGDDSHFTYDLSTPFPYLRPGTRGALLHAYAQPGTGLTTTEMDPSIAANIPIIPPVPWSNPDNALTLDNVYSTAALDDGYTDKLETTGYAPAIPPTADVKGIQLGVYLRDPNLQCNLAKACLTYSGGLESDTLYNSQIWPASRNYILFGSDTELWGRTWTAAEINANDFGPRFQAGTTHGPLAGGTPQVDWMWLYVTYGTKGGWFSQPTTTYFDFL